MHLKSGLLARRRECLQTNLALNRCLISSHLLLSVCGLLGALAGGGLGFLLLLLQLHLQLGHGHGGGG